MLSHLSPKERLALHRAAPAWLSGIRGRPMLIRGVPAVLRGGYARRMVRVCAYCGDHDSGKGWHGGSLLPQHVLSHGICETCFTDYHPFSDRGLRLEGIAN
jgi:hypothetical protein